MLDFRSPLILGSAPAGLLLACLAWLMLGGSARVLRPLDEAEARLASAPAVHTLPRAASAPAGGTTPFGVPTEVAVRLDGISRTARRTAALLAIDGNEAEWISVGATVNGITLVQVSATGAVLDTRMGRRTLDLGETVGSAKPTPLSSDVPPSGVRLPPEPADAPH